MIRVFIPVAALAILLAACGGGGTSTSAAAPVATPTPTPTPAPAGATLATQSLDGAAGYVAPSGFTVYVFDADLNQPAGTSACTVATGCAAHWPAVQAVAGVTYAAPFTVFTRADNGLQQLAYNNHPLYTFTGDSAVGMTNGDGITAFGAPWHIARPQGTVGVTPTGGSTPPPGAY